MSTISKTTAKCGFAATSMWTFFDLTMVQGSPQGVLRFNWREVLFDEAGLMTYESTRSVSDNGHIAMCGDRQRATARAEIVSWRNIAIALIE